MNRVRTSTHAAGRRMVVLAAAAIALLVAFVEVPGRLAAGRLSGGLVARRDLLAAVHAGFVGYWRSGDRQLSPELASVVDYWARFHVIKAVISAALLGVLVVLGVGLWRAFTTASRWRLGLASAGVTVSSLALLATVAMMANVQGAIAPLSSLLPMLWDGRTDSGLREVLGEVRQRLADPSGSRPPAVGVMVDDFGRYHVVIAVLAAILAATLVGVTIAAIRASRDGSWDDRARRALRLVGAAGALLALAMIALAVANAGTASDPAPALKAFFDGGW